MVGCKLIEIKKVVEKDGTLLVMEENSPIPFQIKRIFLVKDVADGAFRGDHATKKTRLILFPINGSCTVMVDDGTDREEFLMDNPSQGLLIEPMIWRSMRKFTPDCVMMAVCDRPFEPGNETYDNYNEFINAVQIGKES